MADKKNTVSFDEWANGAEVKPAKTGILGRAGDLGLSALKSAISVPETAVGLANLVSGGKAGKAVESAGIRFKDAKDILDAQKSDAAKDAEWRFQNAEGFTGKLGAAVENPSLIANTLVESAAPMLAGGVVGRGLSMAAPRLAGYAGAIGEGAIGAGSAAEQIRQESTDGELSGKQAALAGASGLATGLLGYGGGKLADRFGVGDIDTALAGGARTAGVQAGKEAPGMLKRIGGGALSEGVFEELPQSVSEQVLQNVALDRDPMQGVDAAAAMGLLSGGLMGGGMGVVSGQPKQQAAPAQQPVAPGTTPVSPPASTPPADPTLGQSLTGTPMADLMGGGGLTGGANPLQAGLSTLTSNNQMYPGMNTEPAGYTVDPETGAIIQADPVGARQMAEPAAQVEAPAPATQAPAAPEPVPPALGESLTGTPVADMLGRGGISGPANPLQSVLDARTPSQRMGLNPESGGLTAAAAIAVDSGASPVTAGMGLRALSGAAPAAQPVAEQSTPQQQAQPPAQQPILNNGKPFTLAEVGKANQAIGGTAVSVPGGWAIQPPQAAQKPAATPDTAMQPAATPAASAQSAILGRNSQPIAEGGQPFATREEAKAEKRMQPLMRVAPAEGGGFILKPASERQLAAVEKAAKRLKYPSTGETGPRSLHGFILQIGGLASGAMPDIGFDLNPRVGNRRLFSPRGKTIEQAAMAAKQEGYIQDEDENTLIEALKRSLSVSPVYTPDGYEAMAEAQMQARYEDFLAAEQDGGAENDWSRLTPEELADTGYNDYDEATQSEIRALVAQAEALGVDAESILEDVAQRTENATQKDYENAAKSAIEAAIRSSEESRSRDIGQASTEAGPATADTPAAPAAVTGPASDVRARNLAALKARMMAGQTKPSPTTPPAPNQQATPAPEAGPTNQGAANGQGQETLLKAEQPTGAAAMVSGAPVADTSLNRDSSWVIREKATGKVVMETFDRAKVDALNATKYEAVPIQQHLAEQSAKKPSDTTKPGGFTEKVRKAAGKVDAAPAQPILTSPTKADIEAQQARAEQAAKAKAAQDKADAARAAKERERKDIAAASVAASDTFELGGDAMSNLTGQNDLQFSRAAAKEVRNLVTLHNLSEENLMYAGKMGGIPAPSIGITKVETPFGGFGGITLIAQKDLIDPESGVPVYDRDAWTARFPKLNFKKVKAKVADAFYERMQSVRDFGSDGGQFMSMLFEELRNSNVQAPDKITSLFTRYTAPKMLYAQEVLGKAIKPPMRDIKSETPFGHAKSWRDFVAKNYKAGMTEQQEKEFNRLAAVAARDAMAEINTENKARVDERTARMLDSSMNGYLDRYISENYGMNAGILDRAVRDVKSFGKKEVDPMKLDEAVRKVVPTDDAGYNKWIANLVEPLFEAPTITLRGAEVPVTLDNIVDAMTIGKTAGAEKSMTFGAGKAASMLGKQFKSIDEIKAARDRVVSTASESEGKKSTEALISEYQNHVSEFYTGKDWKGNIDTWAALDSSLEALTKAGRSPTDEAMKIALQRAGFKRVDAKGISLAKQALEALRDASTNYFEAKPQRAVRLNEFKGAVVPKGTSAEAIALLEENGITVEVHGNAEGAREKAIQRLAKKLDGKTGNVIFSRDTESPRTQAPTIRAAITKAYGSLLDKLEAKGLVTIAQTEREAIEAAAQARADKTGGDAEAIAGRMMSLAGVDVKYSANGNIEGFFDKQTGKSFLVADNLTAASAPGTLMHEVGIHMAADGKMEALFKRAGSLLKTGTQNEFIQRVKARMARAGETSDEEAAAYIVTEYENDRAKAPITIGKWLADLTAAVRAWLFSKGIILKAEQLTVADIAAVARANARSMARGGPNGGHGGGIRRSFAGEGAATADKMALETARQRVEAGENAETVRKDTGWFNGVDGKWRFEINDSDASIKDRSKWTAKIDGLKSMRDAALRRKFEAEEKRNTFLRSRGESPSRISSETKREPEFKALIKALKTAELAVEKSRSNVFMAEQDGGLIKVGDVLDHLALFSAYPKISETRVAIDNGLQKGNAAYSPESNTITIPGMDDSKQLLTVLLHEIQHGIQNIEGFATGGSPDLNGGFSAYKRLAGEVESRNTEARQGMTDAQRRETAPSATADTPDSDVIVVFNGKDAMSAPAPANADSRNVGDATPDEAQMVQAAIEGKSLIEAAMFLTRSSNKANAAIAQKVADKLKRMEEIGVDLKLHVVHRGDMAPAALANSRGYTESGFDSKGRDVAVWLNGADVAGKVGTEEEVLLHELVHAATTGMVHYGAMNPDTQAGRNMKDLMAVTDAIADHIKQRFADAEAGKVTLTEFELDMREGANNAFRSDDEVLAWALSNAEAQQYLEGIPYKSGSLWSNFVRSVRALLGMSPEMDTALSEVLRVAERLLTDDPAKTGRSAFWHKRGLRMIQQQGRGSIVQTQTRSALPATLNIDGKDRPTTNSNGQPIHPTLDGVRNFWKWFSDSRVVDEQGRPLVVNGLYVQHDEPLLPVGAIEYVDKAFLAGEQAKKSKSKDVPEWLFYDEVFGLTSYQIKKRGIEPWAQKYGDPIVNSGVMLAARVAFQAGKDGYKKPGLVVAKRLGPPPAGGISMNYASNESENGVSVLGIVDPKSSLFVEQTDQLSALFMRDRGEYYVAGLENTVELGSDGEDLLMAVSNLGPVGSQIKSATGNTGAFSPTDPDIRFSRAADMAGNAIDKAKQTADKAMGKDFPRAASMPDLSYDQRSLLGKVGASQSPAADAIKAAADRAGLKIRQGMVDRFAALKELDEKALGQNFIADSITNSAWVLAKMSSAGAGALNAMMKAGRIEMDAQQKVIGLKGAPNGGLTASLQKLGGPAEVERFFAWMAANRSHAIIERNKEAIAKTAEAKRELKNIIEMQAIPGKTAQQVSQLSDARKEWEKIIAKHEPFLDVTERLFTEDEVAAGRTLNTGTTEEGKVRPALYSQVHAEFQQYRDDVLAIAEQTGIINSDNRAMWRDEFYVPFYRVMEDDADRGRSGGNGLSRQEAYKKLKGGKQNLNDLMENTLMNFHHLLSASLKNQAAVQAIKNAEHVGIARKVPEARRDTKTSTFVLVDGKKVFYEVDDPLVFESITTLADPGLNNTAVRVMGAFKRLFTNMTTATPQFIIANTFRDLLQASATSPTSKNIAKNLKEGIQSYRDEKTRAEMLASGGAFSFGHIYGMGADEVKASLQKTVAGAGLISSPSMIPSILRKGWDAWGNVTDLSENASRAATYTQNVDELGKLRAAFEARDVMDFSQHGAWPAVRLLVRIVPFLNARLQGLDKLYRSGLKPSILTAMGKGTDTDKQAAARFAMVTGALTLATMALYLINADDDEYKKLEEWQKDTYWFIRIGDMKYFLPKPFEVGAIATIAERTLQQAMDDKATGKLFRERMWDMLMQTFAFNPTPQMFQPLIDVYSNKDAFTGRDIETAGMERMSAGLRSRDTTTAPATAISAVSRVFGDESAVAVSPVQADHLIKGYLGGTGVLIAGVIDTMYRAATGESEPDKSWMEHQPFRRFMADATVPNANTRYTTLFYDGLKESNRVYADVMELQKLGRTEEAEALAAEKRNPLQIRIALNAQQRRLTEINNRMKEVRRSDKDGEWKRRELDLLNTQKAMITERMGKRIEDARAGA